MILLAADTSTAFYSVAAVTPSGVLGEVSIGRDRRHSERLLETVDNLLTELGIRGEDIGALAVSIGPGSFTGLRIGVSAWKGLALGWGLPLVGVPTLDALARHLNDGPICPVLDAKMSEVYWGLYNASRGDVAPVTGPIVSSVAEMLAQLPSGVTILGDGAERYREEIASCGLDIAFAPPFLAHPRAASVGHLALELLAAGDAGNAEAVEPLYLRGSQAEEARSQSQPATRTTAPVSS